MGVKVDLDRDWIPIESTLPSGWRELAGQHGVSFDSPDEAGAKIRSPDVLLRLLLHHACLGVSLRTTVATAAAIGLIRISHNALHKWMQKCGPWLAAVVRACIDLLCEFHPGRWAGYELVVADATTVQRPGATGTTERLHCALRLLDLLPVFIKTTTDKVGETLCNFTMKAGQLWIVDRGYATPPGLAYAVQAGADVLVRYNFGSLPLTDPGGTRLDARALVCKHARVGSVVEWAVQIHPKGSDPVDGRLIAVKMPSDRAREARRRLVKELGRRNVTPDALKMAGFVVLFTTVPVDRLSAEQLLGLYRLRWQVELDFKRDKSITGLDELPNYREDTIYTWICAKLLGQQIARRLAGPGGSFPPWLVGAFALRPGALAGESP
jgi:hypothetical protein